MVPGVFEPMGSVTFTGSRQTMYKVIRMMQIQTICGKSDGCIPRFNIGGIFSNEKLSQIAARQKAMMSSATSHDSKLRRNG